MAKVEGEIQGVRSIVKFRALIGPPIVEVSQEYHALQPK